MITSHKSERVNYEGEKIDYVSSSLAFGGSLASFNYEREQIARSCVRWETGYYWQVLFFLKTLYLIFLLLNFVVY